MNKKVLPINARPPISFFLHHAIPLSIILAENSNENVLYANYIQLYKCPENKYLFDIYPRIGSAQSFGSFPLDNILCNYILSGDIMPLRSDQYIDNIIRWIDSGYYVNINVDERFIEDTLGYKSETIVSHQCFIMGYNMELGTVKTLNFNAQRILSLIDVKFESLVAAIESEQLKESLEKKGYCDYLVQLRKQNDTVIKYNYTDSKTISMIKKNLYEFIHSIDSSVANLLSYSYTDNCVWGLNTYSFIEKSINNQYDNRFLFQCICGICEHKFLMKSRFQYLISKGIDVSNELSRYEEIVGYFEKLKAVVIYCIYVKDFKRAKNLIKNFEISKVANIESNIISDVIRKIN